MSSPARRSAFVTGAGSGIGKEISRLLAQKGYDLTLLDLDGVSLQQTAKDISAQSGCQARAVVLDVTNAAAQRRAFQEHVEVYGGLEVAVLNAGIGERGAFFDPRNDGWVKTLEVDLTAVLHGARFAAEAMNGAGAIIAVASAGAIFPMPVAPVYAASKAGVAHFVRSAARTLAGRPQAVRLMALCPEFVETPLVTKLMVEDPDTARRMLGSLDIKLLKPSFVAGVAMRMLGEPAAFKAGAVVLVRQTGELVQPYARQHTTLGGKGGSAAAGGRAAGGDAAAAARQREQWAAWAIGNLPTSYAKVSVVQLSSDFRRATRVASAPLPAKPPPGTLLLRRVFAGVNASDVNYSAGRYHANRAQAAAELPFDAGFESVSVVVAAGEGVTGFAPGSAVASLSYGSFSEYGIEPARTAMPVPWVAPEVVALLTSGLTASIGLEQAGRVAKGETVLVTAAAGGTGQFVVQLAKLAGCRVVATCGGPDKARLLRELGADRVIDYRAESVKEVLKREFPKGVDVVWESVGGDMFATCVDALAPRGRCVIIGMMSAYGGEEWAQGSYPGLAEKLLWKSAAAVGFFLLKYAPLYKEHLSRLMTLVESRKLRVAIDPRVFVGVGSAVDAVEHLQGGSSMGKVVVQVPQVLPPGVGVGGAAPQPRL